MNVPSMSPDEAGNDLGVTPDAPWLGLRSFTGAVREYFYGRDAEIEALFDRVQHRTLTVLYGQSGLGKTSLLQAGLIPRLRDADYIPISIRLDHNKSANPLETQVVSAIADSIPLIDLPPTETPTLWELFHNPGFGLPIPEKTPVLIIDQFEELFTLAEEKRPDDARFFFDSLACLVENRPPAAIRQAMDKNNDLVRRFRLGPQPCKVLLVLREDFLSKLERGRRQMPSMMDNRLELRLLSGPQAFRAVYEPGTKHPTNVIVNRETARAIVRFVAGKEKDAPLEEIENVPPLLSLICEQLNARRIAHGETTIRAESLTESAPEVLRNFYHDSFARHPLVVREFVEDHLVSPSGFRESKRLDDATLFLTNNGVPNPEAALRQLVDQRLLVIEDRGGVDRVELTHDIVAPIAAAARLERQSSQRRLAARRRLRRRLVVGGAVLAVFVIAGLMLQYSFAEQEKASYARGLVLSVLNSETVHVPLTIREMIDFRKWIVPVLEQKNASFVPSNERQKLNMSLARLALLPLNSTQDDRLYLFDRLLDTPPDELSVVRDALIAYRGELKDKLWAVVEAPEKGKEHQRLWAASALAIYDPGDPRWMTMREPICNELVKVSATYLFDWIKAFRPVAVTMVAPLSDIYRSPYYNIIERTLATEILADYTSESAAELTALVLDADPIQFDVIYPKFKNYCQQELPKLIAVIEQKLVDAVQDPRLPVQEDDRENEKEKLAKRQANAAVILLKMERDDKVQSRLESVWPLFKQTEDPRTRSYLIHRLNSLDAPPEAIIARLEQESNIEIRRALLLSLGEFREERLSDEGRQALRPKLRDEYIAASDPGLHSAAEWLLRQWGEEEWLTATVQEWANDKKSREQRLGSIEAALANDQENAPSQWFVNSQGQTMVVIPGPRVFQMGSPQAEMAREDDEWQHTKRIGQTFAIAATPTTVRQYLEFNKEYAVLERVTRPQEALDSPVATIDWYQAALYCNWLSQKDEIPEKEWSYVTETDESNGTRVIGLKSGYLGLAGYRLPTEAEMECATRAGAVTARFYGETDELLANYACFVRNSQRRLQRVGKLKPNDWGLFDVHGNVNTWCQEVFKDYPSQNEGLSEDAEDALEISSKEPRVFRGGSYKDDASLVRAAYRNTIAPSASYPYLGFRPTRTIVPSQTAR